MREEKKKSSKQKQDKIKMEWYKKGYDSAIKEHADAIRIGNAILEVLDNRYELIF